MTRTQMHDRIRIFSYLPNPRVWKATIAGRLCGIEVEVRGTRSDKIRDWLWDFDARPLGEVAPDELNGLARASRRGFADATLYKTERFLDANPYGTVPAAFSADGTHGVFESNSIMRLVARLGLERCPLYGVGPYQASRVDSFLDAGVGFGHDVQRYLLSLFAGRIEPHVQAVARQGTATYLSGIERALSGAATALVGDDITLADICFACEIALLTSEQRSVDLLRSSGLTPVLDGELWQQFPEALAHFRRLLTHPAFTPDLSTYADRYETMCRHDWMNEIPPAAAAP